MTDSHLAIWDLTSGALVSRVEGSGPIWRVCTSPTGSIVIGAGGTSPVIWDRTTGARIRQLDGHAHWVKDCAFIDEGIFVSVDAGRTALVWDLATARPILTFGDVESVAVAGDSRSVAFVGASGVRIWSPRIPAPP